MRRTVRALSVAVLASAACGAAGTAAVADPAAEVSPGSARPGATVTVSVTCGGSGVQAPAAIDASSPAFAGHTVRLTKVAQGTAGLAYRGTAQLVSEHAPVDQPAMYREGTAKGDAARPGQDGALNVEGTCPGTAGAQKRPWTAHFTVDQSDSGTVFPGDGGVVPPGGGVTVPRGDDGSGSRGGDGSVPRGDDGVVSPDGGVTVPRGDDGLGSRGDDGSAVRGDDGTAARGDGVTGSRGDQGADPRGEDGTGSRGNGERPCAEGQQSCRGEGDECGGERDTSCLPPGSQHGVEAGEGGAFTDSVPSLAAGAALIAAACAGAAYRLWGGRFRADG
ncbi:hypothetical protein [Streptomyces sp. NPDC048277]|uniref:hypothetical protein n=1 Tax=Streptomyces sp. NPDC048277 TaxID=3155027 RepID=UPI00340891AB